MSQETVTSKALLLKLVFKKMIFKLYWAAISAGLAGEVKDARNKAVSSAIIRWKRLSTMR